MSKAVGEFMAANLLAFRSPSRFHSLLSGSLKLGGLEVADL
jgi:hypothetical protein